MKDSKELKDLGNEVQKFASQFDMPGIQSKEF